MKEICFGSPDTKVGDWTNSGFKFFHELNKEKAVHRNSASF